MQSALHGMIQKAQMYAAEPQRVQFASLEVRVRGSNNEHLVRLSGERLSCDCEHYRHEGLCAHVLTVERLFRAHLPAHAAPYPSASPDGR